MMFVLSCQLNDAERTDRKRYVYAVAIISLYGLLERFVEALIQAFVEQIAQLVDAYDKLPEEIRKGHLQLPHLCHA
jgi:hypothetical protein